MNLYIKAVTKYENSIYFKNRLIKKYKRMIVPGINTQEKIILSLKKQFDLIEINKNSVSKVFWKVAVVDNLNNKQSTNLDFKVYKLINNLKSKEIYNDEKEDILVIFESYNDYFISNSQAMQQLLILEKGISEQDYRSNSDVLINYLRIYKNYKESIIKESI